MILLSILFLTNLASADCLSFVGHYEVPVACQGIRPHQTLDINFTAGTQTLTLQYDHASSGFAPENYLADGAEHAGDINNTGDTYTASCNGNVIAIRRVFHQLKYPLVDQITLNGSGLDYVETFEGHDGATVCRFERVTSAR